jgi:hypothetical protein
VAFGRRRLAHALPMAEWAAFGPRLSLAPGLIRGRPLAHRAVASSRASEASPAALDHGLDGQVHQGSDRRLDRDRAVASFPRGRAACLSSNAIGR